MEYFHTLLEKGGKVIGYGNTIGESDWQVLGHENNRAINPPEEKWVGYKTIPFPHPTFIRMPPNVQSDRRSATTDATKGEEG